MIDIFCKNVPDMLKQMNDAVQNKDIQKISALAHKMIPTASDLNIQSIEPTLKELNALHGNDADFDQIGDQVGQISTVLTDVLNQIKSDFKIV